MTGLTETSQNCQCMMSVLKVSSSLIGLKAAKTAFSWVTIEFKYFIKNLKQNISFALNFDCILDVRLYAKLFLLY